MDAQRFDELARGTAATSRRAALKLLAGATLGAVLTRFATVEADAAVRTCRPLGAHCRFDRQCCSRECRHDVCRRDRRED